MMVLLHWNLHLDLSMESNFRSTHTLIPVMIPFDGVNPRLVIVMDNCTIHHVN